jgi:chlorobactene glucosyltransferase
MIMAAFLYAVVVLLAVISLTVAVNMFAGPFLRRSRLSVDESGKQFFEKAPARHGTGPEAIPSVTVCIPARNEERNIGTLLAMLRAQTLAPRSILVLDDQSQDATALIVAEHAHEDGRVRLLSGTPPPSGWTGKNWACHQLSEEADADVLLFVDADVRPSSKAVEHTVATLLSYQADAVSAFPRQLLSGVTAAMIIPVMDVLLYGFLPLPLVHQTRAVSLAAANGQWFAFTREMYRRVGGHAAVRGNIVEDVELARAVKRVGGRMLLASGNGSVDCRMYESAREIREGFSKNFFAAFGFKTPVFVGVLFMLLVVFVLPFALLATSYWKLALVTVGLNVLIRGLLSWRAGHGLLPLLLHPFGVLAAVLIGLDAIRLRYRHGAVRWKGRNIAVGATGK